MGSLSLCYLCVSLHVMDAYLPALMDASGLCISSTCAPPPPHRHTDMNMSQPIPQTPKSPNSISSHNTGHFARELCSLSDKVGVVQCGVIVRYGYALPRHGKCRSCGHCAAGLPAPCIIRIESPSQYYFCSARCIKAPPGSIV